MLKEMNDVRIEPECVYARINRDYVEDLKESMEANGLRVVVI